MSGNQSHGLVQNGCGITGYSVSFFPNSLWGSTCLDAQSPAVIRVLPSRKHLGRALVRLKIALSLKTSSKNRQFLSIFEQKIRSLAFKVLLVEGSVTEPVAPRFFESCAPVRDILKIPDFAFSKKTTCFFDVLMMLVSSKIALPLETSSKFRRFIFIKMDQNSAPVQGIRKIFIIYFQKTRSPSRHPRNFIDLSSSKSIKMTLPCGDHL